MGRRTSAAANELLICTILLILFIAIFNSFAPEHQARPNWRTDNLGRHGRPLITKEEYLANQKELENELTPTTSP